MTRSWTDYESIAPPWRDMTYYWLFSVEVASVVFEAIAEEFPKDLIGALRSAIDRTRSLLKQGTEVNDVHLLNLDARHKIASILNRSDKRVVRDRRIRGIARFVLAQLSQLGGVWETAWVEEMGDRIFEIEAAYRALDASRGFQLPDDVVTAFTTAWLIGEYAFANELVRGYIEEFHIKAFPRGKYE